MAFPIYVGGTSGVGTAATYAVSLSGTLTGGIASSPAPGDFIVVFTGFGNTAAADASCTGNNSGAYTLVDGTTQYHQNDTYDTEFAGFYFRQGATPDTSLTIGRTNNVAYGGATVVQVWRGVELATPFDVATTVAGAGNTGLINPAAITPTTADTLILAGGVGTQTSAGSAFIAPSNMAGPSVTVKGDGSTSDTGACIASHEWTGGAFDPNVVTGGTVNASCSWRAMTLALRAAPVTTTGDLAATDADADTADVSGAVAWPTATGTIAATDVDTDTIAASGAVLVQGALAATDAAADTSAVTGQVLVQGAAAATDIEADTFAASGTVADASVSGSLAATDSDVDTAAATGTVLAQGALAAPESSADTSAMTGTVRIQGDLAVTEAETDTATLSGKVIVQGAWAATDDTADTANMTGQVMIFGSMAATDSDTDTAQFSGGAVRTGALDATETSQDTAAISGAVSWSPVAGSLASTEAGEDAAAITGEVFILGLFSTTEADPDTAEALGQVYIHGGLAALEDALDTCFATGTAMVRGTGPSQFRSASVAPTSHHAASQNQGHRAVVPGSQANRSNTTTHGNRATVHQKETT